MRITMKWLFDFLVSNPLRDHIFRYNATSGKWQNVLMPRIFTGQATSNASGVVTFDYTAAGFQNAPKVFANVRPSTTNPANRGNHGFCSVNQAAATNTTATGYVHRSTSLGVLLVYENDWADTTYVVDFIAVGN